MDTISSESNETSYLPIAALIIAILAGIFALVGFLKVRTVEKTVASQTALNARVQELEGQVRTAVTTAESATTRIAKVATDTNNAFGQVGEAIGVIRADIAKVQEASATRTAATPASSGSSNPAPTAAAGEYIIKSGDTGSKIARAAGVTLAQLLAANPGVNWNRLSVGQVVKIPGR
jgi:LysM repeat protein